MHSMTVPWTVAWRVVSGRRDRRGYSLVEILVVAAIVAVLMGLLIPAVQAVREMARLTSCQNKLAVLAAGVVKHDDSLGFLPGWLNVGPSPQGHVGWPTALLPYIEQTPAYEAFQTGGLAAVANTDIGVFLCPTAHPVDLATTPAQISYAGNCGQGITGRIWSGVMNNATVASNRLTLKNVTDHDGCAWTLLFAEKCGPTISAQALWTGTMLTGSATWFVPPSGAAPVVATVLALPTGATRTQPAFGVLYGGLGVRSSAATFGLPINNQLWPHSVPSSRHRGGAAFSFCDGSTRFLAEGLDPSVYCQLVTVAHFRLNDVGDVGGWSPRTMSDAELRQLK